MLPVESLRLHDGYWYLCTPYTVFPGGLDAAHDAALELSARLLRAGVPVLSPIAHSHLISVRHDLPNTHDFWVEFVDRPLVKAAYGVIVAEMLGWERSRGIAQELAWAEEWGKPRRLLDPQTLRVEVMT